MRKILFLSDLHMTEAGQTIIGLDPAERLARALDHALANHGDAAHVLILGDLAHHGSPAEYERLATVIARCRLPITATSGAGGSGLSVDEPGAYGIALLHKTGPILHTEDVFDAPNALAEDLTSV